MTEEQAPPKRPTLLANLILMLVVATVLFVFFAFIRGFGKTDVKPAVAGDAPKTDTNAAAPSKTEPPKAKPTPDEVAKSVAQANQSRPKMQPVPADPSEQARTRQLLIETTPRKPFSNVPAEFQGQPASPTPGAGTMPASPPAGGTTGAPEPPREVAAASPEGAALLADAAASIDEAPSDLYPDKAKVKVREGLKNARRIFKVHTVFFEKGGALTQPKDIEQLTKALEAQTLQDAMADPRSVFFVLGFADTTGAADTNKKISVARADAVIALLRDKCGVLNFTYPVAVGPTEIVAPENKEKNRAAEVWLVLP